MTTTTSTFNASRGVLAALRGLALLALCLGLAAGFLAEVWHGAAAPAGVAEQSTTAAQTSSPGVASPAHS